MVISGGRRTRPLGAAVPLGFLAAAVLTACAHPVDSPGSPLADLHTCPAAGSVIGVFTGQEPTRAPGDGPDAEGFDTWALNVNGSVRQLTDDEVHLGAVISPDGRAVYQLRSSGRVVGDSLETPGVVERLDVATGTTTRVAELPGMVDLGVSGDGRWLAAAHTVEARPDTGLDVNSVTVIDLAAADVATTLPRAPDARPDLFSAVTEVALDPDGGRVAYALAIEVDRGNVVNSLRIRDLGSGADTVVYTAPGTDFLSDVEWSADGTTVLAAVRHQEPGDTADSPARFRTLRVDVAGGRTTIDEGFTQDFAPLNADGSRLLGMAAAPDSQGRPGGGALVAWERGRGPVSRLPIDRGGTGISLAACSFQ